MTKTQTGLRWYHIAAIWLIAIGLIAGFAWFKLSRGGIRQIESEVGGQGEDEEDRDQEAPGERIDITEEVARQAQRYRNLSIAQIENERYADAIGTLLLLRELIPADPFVERNLLIAGLLRMQSEQGMELFGGDRKLRDSVVSFNLDISGNRAVSSFLIGQLHEQEKNPEAALEEYRDSTIQNPDFTTGWYMSFLGMKAAADPAIRQDGLTAMEKAVATLPENLFLQMELLVARLELKASGVPETLDSIWKLIEPFQEGIEQRTRVKLGEIIEKAKQDAAEQKWDSTLRAARMLTNVLRPEEIYQGDRVLVLPHLSSYLLRDFVHDLPRIPTNAETTIPNDITWERWNPQGIQPLSEIQDLAVEDLDLDGRLDLCVLRLRNLEAYGRAPGSEEWKLLFERELPQGYQRLLLADLDNDFEENRAIPVNPEPSGSIAPCQSADLDIIVFGPAGIATIENRFDATEQKRQAVPHPLAKELNSQSAVRTANVADLDGDGDLDLIVARTGSVELWANTGSMDFYDISRRSKLPKEVAPNVILVGDRDWDVDQDLVLLGGAVNGVLENLRHGRFIWRENEGGTAASFSEILDAEVFGRNRSGEWGVTGVDGERVSDFEPFRQYLRRRTSSLRELTEGESARRILRADFDNDGMKDCMLWGADEFHVMLMRRSVRSPGVIERTVWRPAESLSIPGEIRGADYGDLDQDGDLDLIWCDAEGVRCATNQGGNRFHWFDLSLIAQQIKQGGVSASGRVNSHGIGSVIEVRTDADLLAGIVRRPRNHFGLGSRKRVDVCRVLWANGIPANLLEPQQDQFVCEQQTLKGSCPYLYAWNGERMEFVTDLLWGAPIGLQFAENVLATPREWEYLKIPGEVLREKEGGYELSLTEELWEAAYFDEVKLFAVDHPVEIEIETNEKVGPPSVAEHRLFTARQKRLPTAVRDSRGNDLLSELTLRDDRYVPAFREKFRQGLVEDHYLEIDFGKLPPFEQLHLYLTGWLYPTDTSINVALSHDSRLNPPRPPSIQVPNANGEWQEAVPFCGFPGGKTKTVVYDLSRVFPTQDYRIRLSTNMEFYWDSVHFTLDEPGETVNQIPLSLKQASLRYRGCSARVEHLENGPERYDYSLVSEEARWPGLQGNLTRFGEVAELLAHSDDQLVVMGAGDEILLKFDAPSQSLPPGWKRDFILYNVGWDKDADLNTVSGTSVEPLPFRGMDAYPPVSPDVFPTVNAPGGRTYQDYLSTYQTRTHSPRRFWRHGFSSTVEPRP